MSTERTNQNEVANRAYRLWENAGRPPGRDLEFWIQAEAEAHGAATGQTTDLGGTSAESPLHPAQSSPSVARPTREFQHRTSPAAQSAARKGTSRPR
jgi:Protein of unknown function (DUF2934)